MRRISCFLDQGEVVVLGEVPEGEVLQGEVAEEGAVVQAEAQTE